MTRGQLTEPQQEAVQVPCACRGDHDAQWIEHQQRWNDVARRTHIYPADRFDGRGVVICAGGEKYLPSATVCIRMLRKMGSQLPVQIWHRGEAEIPQRWRSILLNIPGVEFVDANTLLPTYPSRILNGWELKCYSIIHSRFREVLLLDADNMPIEDPEFLFDTVQYKQTGAIFWPDLCRLPADHAIWAACEVPYRDEPEFETGQIVVDKSRCWAPLQLTMHLNEWSDYYYTLIHGDKDTFHIAWRKLDQAYSMAPPLVEKNWTAIYQHDFSGRRIFQHRSHCKWTIAGEDVRVDDFRYHDDCVAMLNELRAAIGHPNAAAPKRTPTKLILTSWQSPGDILMLTAAVRDLHQSYPGEFLTDVRTTAAAIWAYNPYVTPLDDTAKDVRTIECHYPLIHRSHETSHHFAYGFVDFLNKELSLDIKQTEIKADIHLSRQEKGWISQVQEITREPIPFWIVAAGGKYDYTIKWWDSKRYHEVVDHFRGKIQFVQVGEAGHHHPPLRHVIDLRGKTDARQLIRLVYHAQGVLCGVTFLMHLAAGVETSLGRWDRPCVVVAGGREPPHWEAYPGHEFIHTIGALPCCSTTGCWRSRTLPLGDGDEKDKPINLCLDVAGMLPRCMDMIRPEDVVARIQKYIDRGAARMMTPREQSCAQKVVM